MSSELNSSDEVRVRFLAVYVHGDDVGFAPSMVGICVALPGRALNGVVKDDVRGPWPRRGPSWVPMLP